MCGIAGIYDYRSGRPVSSDLLKAMTGVLAHRGPDGDGFYLEGSIGLGHRRLKVIDLTEAGQQPMVSDDGTLVITFNGEIYNIPELRSDL
jgi:asparagine synthase (glutamine-hydrolysing)